MVFASYNTNVMYVKLIIFASIFTVTLQRYSQLKCLNTADFVTKIQKTEDLLGHWRMAHIKPIYREGFICPAPQLKVTPISVKDIAHWKNMCLHKLDISILDETKFELKVAFPDEFEEEFTIIKREKNEDHIFFPSCKFEKLEFLRYGDYKMWIATREEDNDRIPVAISVPPGEERKCILNENDDLYYFFC